MKTYQLISYINSMICLKIDGKMVFCDFRGGIASPILRPGIFRTSDKKVQEALEKSKDFNVKYKLIGVEAKKNTTIPVINVPVVKVIQKQQPEPIVATPIVEDESATIADDVNDSIGTAVAESKENLPIVAEDVKNAQQARTFLLKNLPGLTMKEVMSKEKVLAKAAEKNIQFPNWEV